MKTITGTTTAWLTGHRQEWNSDPEDIEHLTFSITDMSQNGWIRVGEAEITVHLIDREEITKGQIDNLNEIKRQLQADHEVKMNVLEGRIQSLLAIENKS